MIRLLLLAAGCTNVHVNRTTLLMSTAALACDWAQTRASAAEGWSRFEEDNPVLGQKPSVGTVDAYFLTAVVLNAAVWYLVPERFKSVVPVVVTAFQVNTAVGNSKTIGWCL